MKNFKQTQAYIVENATKMRACSSELNRAKNAKTKDDLLAIIRDNLNWVTTNKLFNGVNILEYFPAGKLIEFNIGNIGTDNTGLANSGDSNSGDRNSGDSNSGDRNSGDSNSGYRNSGAFSTDPNPKLILFDQPTDILVRDWEQSEVVRIMYNLDPTIWVPGSIMTPEEKAANPKWETTEGYLKTISMHDAWANMWGNLPENKKQLFMDLPNFDSDKFKEITGIDVKPQ